MQGVVFPAGRGLRAHASHPDWSCMRRRHLRIVNSEAADDPPARTGARARKHPGQPAAAHPAPRTLPPPPPLPGTAPVVRTPRAASCDRPGSAAAFRQRGLPAGARERSRPPTEPARRTARHHGRARRGGAYGTRSGGLPAVRCRPRGRRRRRAVAVRGGAQHPAQPAAQPAEVGPGPMAGPHPCRRGPPRADPVIAPARRSPEVGHRPVTARRPLDGQYEKAAT